MPDAKAKVIQLTPEGTEKQSERKYGKRVIGLGYSIVPSLIFRAQARLGLSSQQLVVLLHLMDFWWEKEKKPFPTVRRIAVKMKLSVRQVRRILSDLEKAGFLIRIKRYSKPRERISNFYDLSGLVEKLKKLEPEFRKVEEDTKALKEAVAKPGGLKANIG